jgi:DivIVA domain-containing protein
LFWFMLIALIAVVGAVALVALGRGGELPEAEHDRLDQPLPLDRSVGRADIDTLRLPVAVRGYRMTDVDDVLDRVAAELAHRDARIAELEAALAGHRATAVSGTPPERPREPTQDSVPEGYEDYAGFEGYGAQQGNAQQGSAQQGSAQQGNEGYGTHQDGNGGYRDDRGGYGDRAGHHGDSGGHRRGEQPR